MRLGFIGTVLVVLAATLTSVVNASRGSGLCIDALLAGAGDMGPLCTAGDLEPSMFFLDPPLQAMSCVIGANVTNATVWVALMPNAAVRYDIGIVLGLDGGTGLTGVCANYNLSPVSTTNTDVNATCGTGPFYNEGLAPQDACGDARASDGYTYANLGNVTFQCADLDNDGFADISGALLWQQNVATGSVQNPYCTGPDAIAVGTKSKCRFSDSNIMDLMAIHPTTTTAPGGATTTTVDGGATTTAPDGGATTTAATGGVTTTAAPDGATTTIDGGVTTTAPDGGSTTTAPNGGVTTTVDGDVTTTAPDGGVTTTAVPGETTTAAPGGATTTVDGGVTTTAAPGETTAEIDVTTTAPDGGGDTTTAAPGETTTTAAPGPYNDTNATTTPTVPFDNTPFLVVVPTVLGTVGLALIVLMCCFVGGLPVRRACVWFNGTAQSYKATLFNANGRIVYMDLRDLPGLSTGCHQPPFELRPTAASDGSGDLEIINVTAGTSRGSNTVIYLERGKNYALHLCTAGGGRRRYAYTITPELTVRRFDKPDVRVKAMSNGFVYLPATAFVDVNQITVANIVIQFTQRKGESKTFGYAIPY